LQANDFKRFTARKQKPESAQLPQTAVKCIWQFTGKFPTPIRTPGPAEHGGGGRFAGFITHWGNEEMIDSEQWTSGSLWKTGEPPEDGLYWIWWFVSDDETGRPDVAYWDSIDRVWSKIVNDRGVSLAFPPSFWSRISPPIQEHRKRQRLTVENDDGSKTTVVLLAESDDDIERKLRIRRGQDWSHLANQVVGAEVDEK
jgi:hypothetical protein